MLTRPPKPPGDWTWSHAYGTWTQTLAQASATPAVDTAPATDDDEPENPATPTAPAAPATAAPEDEPLPAAASLTGGPAVSISEARVAAMFARRHATRVAAATAEAARRGAP
jgi:hypothetical protein